MQMWSLGTWKKQKVVIKWNIHTKSVMKRNTSERWIKKGELDKMRRCTIHSTPAELEQTCTAPKSAQTLIGKAQQATATPHPEIYTVNVEISTLLKDWSLRPAVCVEVWLCCKTNYDSVTTCISAYNGGQKTSNCSMNFWPKLFLHFLSAPCSR